ncbi:MAG: FKBP-type peptidyl-prolyl cis-trans isomerase [Prolixibacteraceae bacterium]
MKIKFLMNLGLVVIMALVVSSCLDDDNEIDIQTEREEMILLNNYLQNLQSQDFDIDTTDLGVYYITIEEGEEDGEYPETGDTLTVGYSGYFIDGSLFDASNLHSPDGEYQFVLGVDQMIPGWNDGVKQVREGGKIQFIVPSELAYGSEGFGIIGPNQTLVFVVKLIELNQSEE